MGRFKEALRKLVRPNNNNNSGSSSAQQQPLRTQQNQTEQETGGPQVKPIDQLEHTFGASSGDASLPQFQLVGNDPTFNSAVPPEYFQQWMTMIVNVLTYYLFFTPSDRPHRTLIRIILEDMDGVAYTVNNGSGRDTHISTRFLRKIPQNQLYMMVSGIILHECVHSFQNNSGAPGYIIEIFADFCRLKSGCADPSWSRQFNTYKNGYSEGAYFFDYINTRYPGFVKNLNLKMANPWTDDFIVQLSGGETIDQLWNDYKKAYGH